METTTPTSLTTPIRATPLAPRAHQRDMTSRKSLYGKDLRVLPEGGLSKMPGGRPALPNIYLIVTRTYGESHVANR